MFDKNSKSQPFGQISSECQVIKQGNAFNQASETRFGETFNPNAGTTTADIMGILVISLVVSTTNSDNMIGCLLYEYVPIKDCIGLQEI